MHYHLEIVMPPTADVEKAVAEIMEPFDECDEDEDGHRNSYSFWDWYVIGGRWSGVKLEERVGKDRLKAFNQELSNRKVTVSSCQFGKQTLSPSSQISMVDALWTEMFPDSGLTVCPLFDHSPKQLPGDICALADLPESLTAKRVIIAAPDHSGEKLRAVTMLETSIWNGVTWQDAKFGGGVLEAITFQADKAQGWNAEYVAKITPASDWLVVTVDYHS